MKNFLFIIFLSFIFLTVNYEAEAKKYKINELVENKFYFNKRFIMKLPEGKWTVIGKYNQDYYGIRGKVYTLVRIDNKKILENLRNYLQEHGSISVIQFKELLKISRKYAVDLLEYFDMKNYTVRKDNFRFPGTNLASKD